MSNSASTTAIPGSVLLSQTIWWERIAYPVINTNFGRVGGAITLIVYQQAVRLNGEVWLKYRKALGCR
jgi:hypothetical protein